MALDPKTPDEVKDYGVEWSGQLETGTTISTSAWEAPTGITVDADSIDGTATVCRLSGGTAGTTYILVNEIVTSAGETLEAAIQIHVRTAAQAAGFQG